MRRTPGGAARIRLKFQSLLQDLNELLMYTEAEKNRLEKAKRRKRILSAQVKFLRRKYKSFVKNQPEKVHLLRCQNVHARDIGAYTPKHQQESTDHAVHRKTSNTNSRPGSKLKKNSNSRPKETPLPNAIPEQQFLTTSIDLNQTGVATFEWCQPNSRLGSKPKRKNRNSRPKETPFPNAIPEQQFPTTLIDLNQTGMATLEQCQPKDSYPAADNIKPLVHGNVSKAAKTRKRTISWQDPVALWVES